MNDLVTIVVPVYNVEKYLDRCIASIINQTYKNLEIILVDDGSPDRCPEICDNYAKIDPRIKVIHKQNEGLGMARNTGIDNATGDYICFFDSDDYIESDTIEKCITAAISNEADLVIFGNDEISNDGEVLGTHLPRAKKQLYLDKEIVEILLPESLNSNQKTKNDYEIPLSAWNKFYSMDVINKNNWRFVSEREIISEDFYSITELHKYLNRVYILDKVFYHYVVNNASLSRIFRADRFEKIKTFYKSMESLSEKMLAKELLEQPIKTVTLGFIIGAMKQIVLSDMSFKNRYFEFKKILEDQFLQDLIRTASFENLGIQKLIFYKAIKYKLTLICYLLLFLKTRKY